MKKTEYEFSKQALSEFEQEFRDEWGATGVKRPVPSSTFKDLIVKKGGPHTVILKVDDRLIREIKTEKLILSKDPTYDIYKNTKIKAEVVAIPDRLVGNVLYEDSPGFPLPMGKFNRKTGEPYATHYRPKFITMEGATIQVSPGDHVYFHYLTLSPHNFLGKDTEGMELYKCRYDQLFCVIIESRSDDSERTDCPQRIQMLNGYMAIEPYYDDSYEDIEIPDLDMFGRDNGKVRKLKVKQKNGIVYDMTEKPLYRHGKISSITSPSPDGKDYGIGVGDKIVYTHFSEFKNTIEGVEYFIMKIWNTVGVYREGKLIPVGDRVLMDVTPAEQKSKLFLPDKYKVRDDEAIILDIGSHVNEVKKGDKVRFHYSETYFLQLENFRGAFLKENQIIFKISS